MLEEELLRKIAYEIDPDELRMTHDLSRHGRKVGGGMRQRVGDHCRQHSCIGPQEHQLEMINQGSSEVSIMFGIHKEQEKAAVRTLYYTFLIDSQWPFPTKPPPQNTLRTKQDDPLRMILQRSSYFYGCSLVSSQLFIFATI